MKYIKLFEAFESVKLSKTLGFLKSGKKNFIEELKNIANRSDFPFSEYSDEMFQYLPFKKAFNFFWKPEPTICPTCKGEGKYRRPWGRGTRVVDCKECVGGKIQPQVGKVSHIKFWFNSEGKYLGRTAIDGSIKEKQSINILGVKYVVDRAINTESLKDLPNESKVKLWINWRWADGVIWKSGNETWFINNMNTNSNSGGPRGTQWKKWGMYGWNLNGYQVEYREYSPKLLKEKSDELDPFDFNYEVRIGYRGDMTTYKNSDIKNIVNDAEFALILDLNSIKSDKKTSEIILKRRESRSGILKPEDVKRENIERYFTKLSQDFEVSEDLGKISNLAPKIFGWANCLPLIYDGNNIGKFESIIGYYFEFMRGDKSERSIESTTSNIKYNISMCLNSVKEKSPNISENLTYVRNEFQKSENQLGVEFIDEFKSLSNKVYEKILKQRAENLEDLELILQKINSITNMISSNRYEIRNFRYFISRLGSSSKGVLWDEISYRSAESFKSTIEDLKTISNIVDRM